MQKQIGADHCELQYLLSLPPTSHIRPFHLPTHPPCTLALQYPELVALHGRVAALPNVKAYLEGPLRLQKVNNNNLG